MSVTTIKGNKANSTEIKAVLKDYPNAFSTDIPVHNKDFYSIVGATAIKGKGISVKLKAKVFTVDPQEWKTKKDVQKTAEYYGYEVLMILHDPTMKPKKTASKQEENKPTE